MAELVLGVGTSHGPSIQSAPERWAQLGARDVNDPRMDYQSLLKNAKPGMAQEIDIDVQRSRHVAARAALAELTRVIAAAKLDVIVVISNLHRPKRTDSHPVFGILRAPDFGIAKMSERLFDADAKHHKTQGEGRQDIVDKRPGHPALANHLLDALIADGFDIACVDSLAPDHALDDAFSFPYDWLLGGASVPVVPFLLSRDLPNQATAARCHDLGGALGRAIAGWPSTARVGMIASGGFSHQVVDEELDRRVVLALTEGDEAELRSLPRERLNRAPGTPEILNWVALAAAMRPAPMWLVEYVPAYRSMAGTGHGLAFGYWRP